MYTLFQNIALVTMDPEKPLLQNAFLGISDRKIAWIGTAPPPERPDLVVNGQNKVALPGFFNTHTHLAMGVFRGFADEYDLDTWLREHIWPAEAKLTYEAVRAANTLSLAEGIAAGTVSFTDMYFGEPGLAELCLSVGVMGNLSNGATCFSEQYVPQQDRAWRETIELADHYHNREGLIKADVGLHAEYTSNPQVWQVVAALAAERGLNMHVHLSETRPEHDNCVKKYGMTPTALLDSYGIFGTRTTAAHGVFVTEQDMELLRARDVTVAHDPSGNLKLASGVMNLPRLRQKGVRVALATDSACATNTNEMYYDLKLTAILHSGLAGDPTLVSAADSLQMATVAGAYAQGREAESGMLRVGFDADLQVLDLDKPHLLPCHDLISNIVYAARPSDVCMTLCKGKTLYKEGEWLTLDIERAKREMVEIAVKTIRE
ncbi:MAG: amidohydrolase [Clostridiales bacterium]|nr:amidohydrolase [Clostridiales bacterium]